MRFARPVRNDSPGGAVSSFARISNGARRLLIFSYGLFTIAAQTLLFREFITTFEGNDISVGIFFASWFLWVGLGAILVYRAKTFAEKLLKNIEFLFLGYLPAFILQLILIIQARELAGIEPYTLWNIRAILLLSIVVNAPVSIITGMLFPIACRWVGSPFCNKSQNGSPVQQDQELPVSRVYIIEAAGSFLGGLGTTVLLGLGVSPARIFFILAFIVSLSVFRVQLVKARSQIANGKSQMGTSDRRFATGDRRRWIWAFVPICVLVCLLAGADKALMQQVRIIKWNKLFPENEPDGSFQTAQAEYLYGVYQGQWVAIREGSTCEALPDHESAGRIAAITLCQKPKAKRVLVIGSGLGLCHEFLRLPQIETISWAHCDNEYVQKLSDFLPDEDEFKITDERFYPVVGDVRSFLARAAGPNYDIVILNLPDATSSVLNRYYTLEFYRQIKESLRPDGVLAVRVAGGENIMGTELINLGASTKLTLQRVFSQLVLTPGEDTWFIASDAEDLTGDPGTLRDRFATIEGGGDVFPPQALLSVYLPDRAAFALENYSTADLPERFLINRDSRPLTHLYSLLLAAKQSGAPLTKFVKHLALAGPLAFFIPLLVFVALRAIYILKTVERGRKSSFDSTFLVFSAGLLGIGVVIILMYLYQTRFGSLYLHIGVISSVFMVGLTTGAALTSYLVTHLLDLILAPLETRRKKPLTGLVVKKTSTPLEAQRKKALTGSTVKRVSASRVTGHVFAVILVHSSILATIAVWPAEQWTHLIFAIAFALCGVCAGSYFPLAARQLADSAFETGQAGSKLETADHIGASAGGLLTGLALVPVLGTKVTLFVFILLILAPALTRLTVAVFLTTRIKSGKCGAALRILDSRATGIGYPASRFRLRRLAPLEMLQVGDILYKRRFLTGLGYILFGIGVSIILCSNLLAAAGARLRPSLPQYTAQALAGQLRLEQASKPHLLDLILAPLETRRKKPLTGLVVKKTSTPLEAQRKKALTGSTPLEAQRKKALTGSTVKRVSAARKINYFRVCDANDKLNGYIFSSQDLAPEVRGFGGKMNLGIYVDTTGKLINFHIIRSNETPVYLELLSQWRELLNGHQLFQSQPFVDVHAVTGATVSSEAILSSLQTSGHRFATQILGKAIQPGIEEKVHRAGYLPDTQGIYLISAFVLTLTVIYYGGFWSRLTVLCLNLVVGGIVLNAQYSSEQIATVLSLHNPAIGLSGAFLLVVGVPLLVIFFGNIYCGYICPFGAAQELLAYIVPDRFKQPIPVEKMRKARFVKYAVLFILIMVFFLSRDRTTLVADPLIKIFSGSTTLYTVSVGLIVAVALIGSIFYTRFWCRYLCPVGAFLSLLSNVAVLKRYLPAKRFGKCEFGVTAKDQMDCLYCDKCRYEARVVLKEERLPRPGYAPMSLLSRYFVVGVLIVAVLASTVSVSRFLQVIPSGLDYPAAFAASGGEPRDVDLQRIRTMIQQKKLSDREAEFYKKVE